MSNVYDLQLQILTNLNCNLNCTYCYENKGQGCNDINKIKEFILARLKYDYGNDLSRNVVLDFIGGESLLYPKMLDEICLYTSLITKAMGITGKIQISLSTNGTLIAENEDVQKFLFKWKPAVGFSIDGTKDIHDDCRIDIDGNPSYDRAVAGYNWVRSNIPCIYTGVKATYTHKTINRYADGIINLIDLGFTDIAANTVFEEEWTLDDAVIIAHQMFRIVDYLFDNNLYDKVNIFQINHKDIDMKTFKIDPDHSQKDQNHCGTCKYMRCIGFDGKIYGCNRFCTMKNPIPIGDIIDSKIVISDEGKKLIDEVSDQYLDWPDECKKCPYERYCPSCSAIPYEQDGSKSFFARKPQCGFTQGMIAGKLYFQKRLLELELKNNPEMK